MMKLLLFILFSLGASKIISYTVDPQQKDVQLYWKDDSGHILRNIQHLKEHFGRRKKELLFATNAGMYKTDNSPLGLFIQHQKTIAPLNTAAGNGNFYIFGRVCFKNIPAGEKFHTNRWEFWSDDRCYY